MRPAPGFKKQATQFQELETLRLLMPPTGLVFVGAGNGVGPLHQWQQWDIPAVTLVDADVKKLAWAEKHPQNSNWNLLEGVVGKAAKETPYYHASNIEEDGTINPLLLKPIWPNLQINQEDVCKVQPLTDLLSIEVQQQANWILVDCLPALDILSSAEAMLENLEVVCARVLLNQADEMPAACTLQALQSWGASLALALFRVVETNNPAVGYAVLAKNWKHALKQKLSASNQQIGELQAVIKTLEEARGELKNGLEASKQTVVQHQQQITELKTAVEAQAREIEELKSTSADLSRKNGELKAQLESGKQQAEKLTQERDAQTKLATDRQAQIGALTNERDETRKQAADAKGQIESLTKAKDEQAKLATDRQTQIVTLTKEQDETRKRAADTKSQLETITIARDEQTKLAADRQAQIASLTKERDEARKQAADTKAQLELITKARDEQTKLAADRQNLVEQLSRERDEGKKLAFQINTQLESLMKARDEQHILIADHDNQIRRLAKERDEAMQDACESKVLIDQLRISQDEQVKLAGDLGIQNTKLTKELDEVIKSNMEAKQKQDSLESLAKKMTDRVQMMEKIKSSFEKDAAASKQELLEKSKLLIQAESRLAALQIEMDERDCRQQLLHEEMTRAEAQIDLIKDIVFKESGL
jgi:DNA repair exonuclease SbcCD ATPase subunit